jgi:hypothetical protein
VIDPGVDARVLQVYGQLRDAGEMTIRTDLLYRARAREEVEKGLSFASLRADDWLRFAGIKVPLDGGVEAPASTSPTGSCRASSRTRPTGACSCCRPAARTSTWRP